MQVKSLAVLLILAISLSLFGLAACGQQKTPANNEQSEASKADNTEAPATTTEAAATTTEAPAASTEAPKADATADLAAYFGTKEEALKTFGLEKAPESAIALSWTDNIYLLDAGAKVPALPDNHHLPAEVLEKAKLFTDHDGKINLDLIKELKPSIIFANAKTMEKQTALAELAKTEGIQIAEFPKAKTYQDVLKLIGSTAVLCGDEAKAKTSISGYLQRIADARESLKGLEGRKVAILNVTKDGRQILAADNFTGSLIDELGLKNVALDLKLQADKSGYAPMPEFKALADAGCEAVVMMVRIKGDKELKAKTVETLTKELKEAFGADSEVVKNERYGVVDHHGMIIAIPNAIAGIENIADIASR